MDEIDFSVFFNILWVNKNLIFTFITVFSLTSIFYAISLDNIYTAKSIINPSSGDNPSNLSNQYGGIAAIAGIDLNSSDTEVQVAIAFINSKRLVSELMKHDSFLPNLMASKKWDIKNQEILGKITWIINFMAFFSILTGLIVLVGSVRNSKYQRIKESVTQSGWR